MAEHAYIKLIPGSTLEVVQLDDIKELFHYYKTITEKTGVQLDWNYSENAFPYEIIDYKADADYIHLKATEDRYHSIFLGVGKEQVKDSEGLAALQHYIELILPELSTYGDKGKANEFSKFLAKKLKGELHLFNKRRRGDIEASS
ncbi:DUF1885 family protein [Peribacillus psychrosaccharolyticus]|uniref:DUF1885 family protein n=1 Tax=Peribacillus psychrosaccharolyticus TaxID=1407 RepID=UPI000313BDA5|nr:DUF1885 family protein [Peribacillus psychrosaccharolyticus]